MAASAYHLKPADMKKLFLAATNFRDRCLVKTLWWLGLRRHELIVLDIRDLDVPRKRVTIRAGKGGKTRVVPIIDDEFLSDLLHLIGPRKTGPVFLSNENKALSLRLVNHIVRTSAPLCCRLGPAGRGRKRVNEFASHTDYRNAHPTEVDVQTLSQRFEALDTLGLVKEHRCDRPVLAGSQFLLFLIFQYLKTVYDLGRPPGKSRLLPLNRP